MPDFSYKLPTYPPCPILSDFASEIINGWSQREIDEMELGS